MRYATLMVHMELGSPNDAVRAVSAGLAAHCAASVIGVAASRPMAILYQDGVTL